jgi:hypothetical protein
MDTDSRMDSDLRALADATTRGLPTIDDSARALARARARRKGRIMEKLRKPMWMTLATAAVVLFALLFPVPYTRSLGYELTVRGADGHEVHVRVATRDRAQAERRAAELRQHGAAVAVAARTQRVWGSVFAMAKEKLLHIEVTLAGKSEEEVAADIRAQLTAAGWNANEVQVERKDGESRVQFSADDGNGRKVQVVRHVTGGGDTKMDFDLAEIDQEREPGMTDAQLRDKILKQLEAHGMSGDVKVDGANVEVHAQRRIQVR